MSERMTGSDAVLLHMEDANTPMHTLKIVILDPSRRGHGRGVTLDELALAVGSRLGLVPRATQKVVAAPGFGGRPFWVDDPDFDLRRHLDERTLDTPGGARQLDILFGELASSFLPRDRALWDMTLVHGLAEGQQAVVVRVHHAIADGLGALHTFLAATTEEQGDTVDLAPAGTPPSTSRRQLTRAAAADAARTWRSLPGLARSIASGRQQRQASKGHPDIPSFFSFGRTSLNAAGDATRVCASGSFDLATVKAIGRATGTTVNGVLHAVVAGALRDELAERGEDVSESTIAAFGIASDTSATDRTCGNFITPTFVRLRSDLADPRERLEATARSCKAAVEARRQAGLDLTDQFSAHAPRALNLFRRLGTRHTTMNPSHVVTANCAGPKQRRWLSDIEIVDWFSFAVSVAPAAINITVHSYDGRMNVGIVTNPIALPEPDLLMARLTTELQLLADAVGAPPSTTTMNAREGVQK
jgi:WS/DGAT/MGAT family acyltransferase